MRDTLKRHTRETVEEFRHNAGEQLDASISQGTARMQHLLEEKLNQMVTTVKQATSQAADRFAGVNEEEILTFVPDSRAISGVSSVLLAILFALILPGGFKLVSLLFLAWGAFSFLIGYVNQAKIDVPDGYEGVVCRFGKPSATKARKGRNWHLHFSSFVPFLVSQRDQVVDMDNGNFTGDSASIALSNQTVFRVTDTARFISNTSPAAIMRILNLYGSYIALRIITSIDDARVKFTGRDRLDNMVAALNGYLTEYGVEVIRTNMPRAHNDVLQDLEEIRTQLKETAALSETKRVRLESAIKAVESEIRTKRKESRSCALSLQQSQITLETNIAERINELRQGSLINARRRLEEKASLVRKEIAGLRAKLAKVRAIRSSFAGLEAQLGLREAAIKRAVFQRMMPRRVQVFSVAGIGPGLGMSVGNQMLSRMLEPPAPDSQPQQAVEETDE